MKTKILNTIVLFFAPILFTFVVNYFYPQHRLIGFGEISAQNVGINSTGAVAHPSALLDLNASPTNNKGFAMPSLTTAQRLAIAAPKDGLQVYDTNLKGFYYFNTTSNKWDCVTTPAGTFNYFCNVTAPIGYLECNGQSVSTTTYPELFNAIGYLYGGAGASFNVPDLRGEFIRSAAGTGTVDAGRVVGTKQKGTLVGGYDDNTNDNDFSILGNAAANFEGDTPVPADYPAANGFMYYVNGTFVTMTPYAFAGLQGMFNVTRPRNVALLPCIKY